MTRKYSDKEVALILQRALEPGSDGTDPHDDSDGLSLGQIKEIAAEVGISPSRIEGAAAGLLEPDLGSRNRIAGIATTIQFQETLEGLGVGADDMPDLVSVIRASMGRQGIVGSEFGSLEWKAADFLGARYVSVSPTRDGTRVRVLGNFRDGLGIVVAMAGFTSAAFVGILLDGAGLGNVAYPIVAAAAVIPGPFLFRWARSREDKRLRLVFDRLVALLRSRPESESTGVSDLPPAEDPPALPSGGPDGPA